MREHRKSRDLMVSVLCGEADDDARCRLEAAIAADEDLALEYREMKETLGVVSDAGLSADPGPEFWRGVWPQFMRKLRAQGGQSEVTPREAVIRVRNWRPAMQIAVVAAMLVLGIFIGKMITEKEAVGGRGPQDAAQTLISMPFQSEIEERRQDYFYQATGASLQRSGNLIKSFMELRPHELSERGELISNNRELGGELLNEISALRGGLSGLRFIEIEPMLDEIELFIGEIAGIEGGEEDLWFEIEALQKGITERRLLDRMNQLRIRVVQISQGRPGSPYAIIDRR